MTGEKDKKDKHEDKIGMKKEKDKIRKWSNECGLELDYFWCQTGTWDLDVGEESEVAESLEKGLKM